MRNYLQFRGNIIKNKATATTAKKLYPTAKKRKGDKNNKISNIKKKEYDTNK